MKTRYFDLRPGEAVTIGDSRVTVEHKTGQRARLRVETAAPLTKHTAGASDAPVPQQARPRPTTTPATAPASPYPFKRPGARAD